MSAKSEHDLIDKEFEFYVSEFENLLGLLPNKCFQEVAKTWKVKLSDSLYTAEELRENRNRYFFMLTLYLCFGVLKYPFDKNPPNEKLPNIRFIKNPSKLNLHPKSPNLHKATTEMCVCHANGCPHDDRNISKILDQQFEYLVESIETMLKELPELNDRRRGRMWLRFLSSVDAKCCKMKEIRNDYAMLLSGYASNGELLGPFLYDPIERLCSLPELVRILDMQSHMNVDPSHPRAMQFLNGVPYPQEGAFAFLAVTGNIGD